MNPMQIIFGLIIFNLSFGMVMVVSTGQTTDFLNDYTEIYSLQRGNSQANLTQGQEFFMQEPSSGNDNWLESLIRFGQIFGFFIGMLAGNTVTISMSMLTSGNVFITFFSMFTTAIFGIVNCVGIYTIYKLLRNP